MPDKYTHPDTARSSRNTPGCPVTIPVAHPAMQISANAVNTFGSRTSCAHASSFGYFVIGAQPGSRTPHSPAAAPPGPAGPAASVPARCPRSEEHTSELQSRPHLVCRLLLEKKKNQRRHDRSEEHTSEL